MEDVPPVHNNNNDNNNKDFGTRAAPNPGFPPRPSFLVNTEPKIEDRLGICERGAPNERGGGCAREKEQQRRAHNPMYNAHGLSGAAGVDRGARSHPGGGAYPNTC